VLAFIIAAVVTPPDVVSQLALAIPMCLLYELGIWAAKLFIRHTQAPVDSEETPAQTAASQSPAAKADVSPAETSATEASAATPSASSERKP